jgi:predicted glycoside hydrolase/deacetylase ChbG (UPF0249 family)
MADTGTSTRRLIVSADDFGLSPGVNAGILIAHRDGILTDASLMVNGAARAEAVELARATPTLSVGLHLVLVQGRASAPPHAVPALVDRNGMFRNQPVLNGFRYFFTPGMRAQLEREIRAQLDTYAGTGLPLSHVDGHLNVRKVMESVTFRGLVRWALPRLRAHGMRYPDQMFGLHQSGHVTESYVLGVVAALPPGVTEIYCHASQVDVEARRWRPADYECEGELAALTSARVRAALDAQGVTRMSYRELACSR